MRLEGKIILITGASGGIGAACADKFRKRGAKLSLVARSEDNLKAVAQDDALYTVGDITDAAVRAETVDRTLDRYGRIDILINNAGVGLYAPSWQAQMEDIRAMYEINVFSAIAMTQLVVPHMREQRSGLVVNISSIAGKITLPWFTLYSSTKFALSSLTEGLRMELARDGVGAMLVCPGYVKTGFQDNVIGGRPPDRLLRSKKFAITPDDCAEAIANGIERGARTVNAPGVGRWLVGLHNILPGVVERQLARMNARQPTRV